MQALLEKLSGKKTYGLAVLLFVLAGADVSGLVPEENRLAIYAAVGAGVMAAMRLAISKLIPQAVQEVTVDGVTIRESLPDSQKWRDIEQRLLTLDAESKRQFAEAKQLWDKAGGLSSGHGSASAGPSAKDLAGAGVLLLCLCLPAIATAGDIRIVGPASVPAPGYPCELYIQGDLPEGTGITWDYSPRLEGLPLVESVSEQNGSIARLNTMAGSYRLVVAIAVPGQKPVLRYHNFYVPGTPYVPPAPVPPSPPVPQPQPQPTPTPIPEPVNPIPPQPADPVFEDGQFGMAAATYRAVMAVNSTNRREEALCLVKRLLFIRNSIQSGSFDSVQTIVNALAQAFNECLPETWNRVRDKLTDRIADLLQARRLTTMQHWQTLADEALLGLTEAGKR